MAFEIDKLLRAHMTYRITQSFVHFPTVEMADAAIHLAGDILDEHTRCCSGKGVRVKAYPIELLDQPFAARHVPDMQSCSMS